MYSFTIEENRKLCKEYPWLYPRNVWTDEPIKDFDYSYTLLDDMPNGWRIAFGKQMCEEINNVLKKADCIRVACGGVYYHAAFFIYDDDITVFIKNGQRYILRLRFGGLGLGYVHLYAHAAFNGRFGLG